MAGQLPASVLSRALRSRGIRPQLALASAQCLTRKALSPQVQRYFSSETSANETTPFENDPENEPETSPHSQPAPSLRDRDNADENREGGKGKPKSEGQAIMDIATATVTTGSGFTSNSIAKELKWVADPKDLADRVGRLLRAGDLAQAAALTREAQRRQMKSDGAWNHLMRYAMDKGYPEAAFKFYNDMKKRGQMPTAKTYTVMLQGFANQPQSRLLVKKAESVYRSIFSKQSQVKPNVIHSNAMLGVCQRHGDMDSLWRIAGEMPDEGNERPDERTYSIILAALQHAARNDVQKMDASQIDQIIARQEKMVIEGKRIWADVVYQWKENGLDFNNQLVNSMAYLLLDGVHDSDFYDIFALYNQTMGIPILVKKPTANINATRRRAGFKLTTEHRAQLQISKMDGAVKPPEDVPFVDENNRPINPNAENNMTEEETLMEEEEMEREDDFESLFEPVVTKSVATEPIATEAEEPQLPKPDNKDLTMILTACFNMTQGSGQGPDYWNFLTKGPDALRVQPDEVSSMVYMRLLRQTRSSKIAVQTIREQLLPVRLANGNAFHVALATCRRDRRNKHILVLMSELLDMMRKAWILPDPRVLEGYQNFIETLCEDPQALMNMDGLGKISKHVTLQSLGKQLVTNLRLKSLATLRPHVIQMHEAIQAGKVSPRTRWEHLKENRYARPQLNGHVCLGIMNEARRVIGETLKPEFSKFVSKAERKILLADSTMLKPYSDFATIKAIRNKTIYPTREQRVAFDEMQMEFLELDMQWISKKKKQKQQEEVNELLKPPQLEAEIASETKPEIEAKPEVETKPDVEAKPEVETKPEAETKPDVETKV